MSSITLREARKKSGLTATQVAAAAGCDRASLYRIEAGESCPRRETARRLFALYKGQVSIAMIYDPQFVAEVAPAA